MKVLFYVQHLLGVGHVFRAMRIVRALGSRGVEVDLVYGGEPVPNLDAGSATVHYLPPLRAGSTEFRLLETPDGTVADEIYRAGRCAQLLAIFNQGKPDAVVTEAFPFGRRQMRFELLPLLSAARDAANNPLIICSVRDILQERIKPGRNEETVGLIDRYFDHVLVHGDPKMVRLEETFPLANQFAGKTRYTGIVAPDHKDLDPGVDVFDVVVSVGGGMLGPQLLEAAAMAKPLSSLSDARWIFAAGPGSTTEQCDNLRKLAGKNVTVVPFIDDLVSTLAKARLSISRCGYNTVADLFVSGCRAIVAPLSDGVETEQLKRADILAKSGFAEILGPDANQPDSVARLIDRAIGSPTRNIAGFDLSGAQTSAEIITECLANRVR